MNNGVNQFEQGSEDGDASHAVAAPDLLTVRQAYDYLIAAGLPRSKKTIRKWCRLGHVDIKQNVIPGGPKWLITRRSLDARIAEERLIDASLTRETGSHPSEGARAETTADRSAPVRNDELVEVLKQQLAHEREARTAAESKTRDLITMYHEISMASTQFGIEIAKGMQTQGRARPLGDRNDPGANGPVERDTVPGGLVADGYERPAAPRAGDPQPDDRAGDNESPGVTDDPIE